MFFLFEYISYMLEKLLHVVQSEHVFKNVLHLSHQERNLHSTQLSTSVERGNVFIY